MRSIVALIAALTLCISTSAALRCEDFTHTKLNVVGFTTIAAEEALRVPNYAGTFSVEGAWHAQGYQVWAARTNEVGGIFSNGTRYCVNLTIVNVGSSSNTSAATFSRQVARRYASDPDVHFLLAPFSSTMTLPVALETEGYRKLMLAASASSTTVYQCKAALMAAGAQPDCVAKGAVDLARRFEFLFGAQPPAENVVQPLVTLYKLKNVKTIVTWMEDQPYTRSIAQGAVTAAPFVGITLVKSFVVAANPTFAQVDAIMDEIVSLNPDAIVGGTYYFACQHFIKGCKNRNWFPKALFMSLCSGDARATLPYDQNGLDKDGRWTLDYFEWDYRLRGPDYEDFYLFPSTTEKPSPSVFRDYFRNFHNGSEPAHFAAIAAGLGEIFHTLMNRTGRGVDNELYRQLLSQSVLTTFIGKLGFNGWGQNNAREVVIVQPDRDGQLQLIYPLGSSSAEFAYPIPKISEREFTYRYGSSGVEIAFNVIAAILMAVSIAILIVIYVYRENQVIFASAPVFLSIIVLGSLIIYSTVFTWQIQTNRAACTLRFWMLGLGFVLMFGALFSKTYRVARIFRQSKLVVLKITNKDVGAILAGLVAVEIVLLIIWTAVAQPDVRTIVPDADRPALNQLVCSWTTADLVILIVACVYKGLMIIAGIAMSILIWKIPMKTFNEAKQIGFSMYNMLFFVAIGFGLQVSNVIGAEAMFVIRSLCILLSTAITIVTIFVPKFMIMHKPPSNSSSGLTLTRSYTGGSVLASKGWGSSGATTTSSGDSDTDASGGRSELQQRLKKLQKQFDDLKAAFEKATGEKYDPKKTQQKKNNKSEEKKPSSTPKTSSSKKSAPVEEESVETEPSGSEDEADKQPEPSKTKKKPAAMEKKNSAAPVKKTDVAPTKKAKASEPAKAEKKVDKKQEEKKSAKKPQKKAAAVAADDSVETEPSDDESEEKKVKEPVEDKKKAAPVQDEPETEPSDSSSSSSN